eukprot:TRINITY_DN2156_c1_g1_i1.p1 TRINITY_DN2156_c1_g1~~TRINITY_DN2156_c1_g1_i1.p1  ORF type:complete len:690 (-),score=135.64 TRINITY_DN2156_c1_g1_i1:27-2096(-)
MNYYAALFSAFLIGVFTTLCALYYALQKHIISLKVKPLHQWDLFASSKARIFDNGNDKEDTLEDEFGDIEEEEKNAQPATIRGILDVQLAGKLKTRQSFYCALRGDNLCIRSKKIWLKDIKNLRNTSETQINLSGCKIRMIDSSKSYEHALEIVHESKPILPKVNYLYLLAKNTSQQNRWFKRLSEVCQVENKGTEQHTPSHFLNHLHGTSTATLEDDGESTASESSPASTPLMTRSFQPRLQRNPSVLSQWTSSFREVLNSLNHVSIHGWLKIQKDSNKKTRSERYCLLYDAFLFHYKSDKIFASDDMGVIDLSGCTVREAEKGGAMGHKQKKSIVIERADGPILPATHALVLVAHTPDYRHSWDTAIREAISKKDQGRARDSKLPNVLCLHGLLPPRDETRTADLKKDEESTEWLNDILHRFYENIRVSPQLNNSIKDKLTKKMISKVYEKGFSNYIESISVDAVDLGMVPPTILAAELLSSKNGNTAVDFRLEYHGSIKLRLKLNVLIPKTMTCYLTATLRSLQGKLAFRCPEYPAEMFSLSFYQDPAVEVVVDTSGNPLLVSVVPNIDALLEKKLRQALWEKMVAPNRLYVPIPKSNPKDTEETSAFFSSTGTGTGPGSGSGIGSAINKSPMNRSSSVTALRDLAPISTTPTQSALSRLSHHSFRLSRRFAKDDSHLPSLRFTGK